MPTDLEPEIVQKSRAGDIRHNIPDISLARRVLGYCPQQDFGDGLAELAEWVALQDASDKVEEARLELESAAGRLSGRDGPIVITGGAGFIGSNLADRLASDGRDVIILDHLGRPGVERNLAWLRRSHGTRISSIVADIRRPGRRHGGRSRRRCYFPLRRTGCGHDQPRESVGRPRSEHRRDAERARGGASPRRVRHL